jgi:hypothetical protein
MNEEEIIWCLRIINQLINAMLNTAHASNEAKFNQEYPELVDIRERFVCRLKYVRFQESKGFDGLVGNRYENYWVPGEKCNE